MDSYRRAVREAKESIDKQITGGILEYETYKYMVGRSTGLQDALNILDNLLTKGVKTNEY